MTLDQQTANTLFHAGAIFLILDLPSNITLDFGIDLNTWKTGPKFKGLKLIPPGIHCIYYGVVNRQGGENVMSRHGFWKEFKKGQVCVSRWNAELECIDMEHPMDPEEHQRYVANIRDFDPYLGAYPLKEATAEKDDENTYQRWLHLTQHITTATLERVLPHYGLFNSIMSTSHHSDILLSSAPPSSERQDELRIHFQPFQLKKSYPPQATAAEMTKYSIDKSYLLLSLAKQSDTIEQGLEVLLSEMQVAFVLFLMGHIYDGFEQWKNIFVLMCSSEECMRDYPMFFVAFLNVVQHHMSECPADLFYEILGQRQNFVQEMLTLLVQNAHALQLESKSSQTAVSLYTLLEACERMCHFIHDKFGWVISMEIKDEDEEGNQGFGKWNPDAETQVEME